MFCTRTNVSTSVATELIFDSKLLQFLLCVCTRHHISLSVSLPMQENTPEEDDRYASLRYQEYRDLLDDLDQADSQI